MNKATLNSTFIKPRYDRHGFSNLPALLASLLGGPKAQSPFDGLDETYDNVLLFLSTVLAGRNLQRLC